MAEDNSKVKIRFQKATYSDVGFLTYLRKITMDEHLKLAGIEMSDEQHRSRVLEFFDDSYLIYLGKANVGVIKLGVENGALHIRQFQILPEFQGKGIGRNVLEVCKKKAKEKQVSLTLNVLKQNPAKSLYSRNGFQIESSDALQHFMRCSIL